MFDEPDLLDPPTDTPLKAGHKIVDSTLTQLANRISDKQAQQLLNQKLRIRLDEERDKVKSMGKQCNLTEKEISHEIE